MRVLGLLTALGLMTGLMVQTATAENEDKPAAASDIETARAEIQLLRERIAVLEAQCPDLSGQEPPPAGGVEGGTLKYLLKARWDLLKTGMESDEVKVLLGWPDTVTRSAAGQVEIWGYGSSQVNRYGVGTVYFDDDQEVTTWMSPTFKTN